MQLNWLESCKLKSEGGVVKSDVEFLGTDPSHYKSGLGFILTSQSSPPNVSLKSTQQWSSKSNESSVLGFCSVGQFFSLSVWSLHHPFSPGLESENPVWDLLRDLGFGMAKQDGEKTLLFVFWVQRQEGSWVYAESSFSERVWSSAEKDSMVEGPKHREVDLNQGSFLPSWVTELGPLTTCFH